MPDLDPFLATSTRDSPESRRHTDSYLTPIVVAAATVLVAGCSGNGKSPATEPTSGHDPSNSVSASSNPNSGTPTSTSTTTSPENFSWGQRIKLSLDSYGTWDPTHPEPIRGANLKGAVRYLLVVDDARYNFPADPDPNTDKPTGLYAESTQDSAPVTRVSDGTLLKVIAYTTEGKLTSDAHGGAGYPTWEEVVGRDGATAWVPWVNAGYTDLVELHDLPQLNP